MIKRIATSIPFAKMCFLVENRKNTITCEYEKISTTILQQQKNLEMYVYQMVSNNHLHSSSIRITYTVYTRVADIFNEYNEPR